MRIGQTCQDACDISALSGPSSAELKLGIFPEVLGHADHKGGVDKLVELDGAIQNQPALVMTPPVRAANDIDFQPMHTITGNAARVRRFSMVASSGVMAFFSVVSIT